jgi:hypothetical protein
MRKFVALALFLTIVLAACGGGESEEEGAAQPTGGSPAAGDCVYVIRDDGERQSAQFPDGYPAAYWDRQTALVITVMRPDGTTFEVDVPECLVEEGRRLIEVRKGCNAAEEQRGTPFGDRSSCFSLGP